MFHKNKHNFGLIRGQIREKKNYQVFPIHYFNVPHLLSVLSHWLSLHNKMNQAKEGGGCYCQEEGAAEHWAPCDRSAVFWHIQPMRGTGGRWKKSGCFSPTCTQTPLTASLLSLYGSSFCVPVSCALASSSHWPSDLEVEMASAVANFWVASHSPVVSWFFLYFCSQFSFLITLCFNYSEVFVSRPDINN